MTKTPSPSTNTDTSQEVLARAAWTTLTMCSKHKARHFPWDHTPECRLSLQSVDLTDVRMWQHLLFTAENDDGTSRPFSPDEVQREVAIREWQQTRISMLRTTLAFKMRTLEDYITRHGRSFHARCVVTNYVNALKRGGLIR